MAMLVVGTVLVALGISASDSVTSELSRFFSGQPTSYSLWMLLGGLVLVVIGAGGWAASRTGPHRA
jgi:hypothetical protein